MTLEDAAEAYLLHRKTQVAHNTWLADQAALTRLVRLLGSTVEVRAVAAPDIDRYVADMAGCNPSSRNLRVRKIKQFFDYAQRRGWVTENPVERRPEREVEADPLFIPRERFPELLAGAGNPRDRAVVACGLYLFLRGGEMQTLRVSDIQPGFTRIKTTQHKTGGRDVMPVCAELGQELRSYLRWYTDKVPDLDGQAYLLPATRRVMVMPHSYPGDGKFRRFEGEDRVIPHVPVPKPHRIIQRALEGIGMPTFRQGGHTLRRSGARALFDRLREEEGVDGALQTVKSMLHHESVTMTERYLGVTPERDRRDTRLAGKPMFDTGHPVDNVVPLRRGGG